MDKLEYTVSSNNFYLPSVIFVKDFKLINYILFFISSKGKHNTIKITEYKINKHLSQGIKFDYSPLKSVKRDFKLYKILLKYESINVSLRGDEEPMSITENIIHYKNIPIKEMYYKSEELKE